jgi:ribonuclease Z
MLFGPLGFVAQVAHKLAAYNWNLIARNEIDFVIGTVEFDGVQLGTAAEFHSRDAFTRRDSEVPKTEPGVLLDDEAFRVRAVALDHGIPSLAFAFEEKSRINVWKVRLEQMGLPVGPWLNGLKEAVRRGEPDEAMVVVSWAAADGPRKVTLPLGELKAHALHIEPGRKLAYVVDAAYHEENAARIVELARGAERLFIEAVFLSGDAAIGARRRHLTAAQAGFLARRAAVGRVLPLHFSPRYLDREQELRREVEEAFQGRLDPSVSGRRQREVREPAAP